MTLTSELLEFAESEFKLNKRQKDGATLRQHLLMAYQATGRMPEELANAVEVPENAAHVWWWFLELSKTRSNGFNISAISYLDIDAWSRLTGTRLEPWELRAICLLDAKFIEVHA